jgi:allantoinase
MTASKPLDLVVKNVRAVRPGVPDVEKVDLGIADGKFVRIASSIAASDAREVFDGKGRLAFPGLVDAHMHVGIYAPLEEDAPPESRAAAAGGVTTSLNYMRTGQYYLNQGGPYARFFPEVLRRSAGKFHVDYAYHLAPIAGEHVDEMELLVKEHGVTSFKIFMFYGSHGLHGRSTTQNAFLMIDEEERYDVAHFERIMRELSRVASRSPAIAESLSLSLHCELGEILTAYTRMVEKEGKLTGLAAYSASRPPHSEGLAIFMASYLANETSCANVNLLHLSSRKAIEAALTMRDVFPHVDFRREVTVGHLLLDVTSEAASLAKVNPPIRPREDVERLWEAVLTGDIDWICSDHACCAHEKKIDARAPKDIFAAKSGFGGTEYLLSGVYSEGKKRGLPLHRMAELLSRNPARRFGLHGKGDIAIGHDADLAILDPDASFVVRAAESPSQQGYTPFEGMELTGKVTSTFLRGARVYHEGVVEGEPRGRYLRRPYGERQA